MLGLYYSRITVEMPKLDKKIGEEVISSSKMEKYENSIKSCINRERVYQAISIIQNYSMYSADCTHIKKEFQKKSKSYVEMSNYDHIKENSVIKTPRKLSTYIQNNLPRTIINLTNKIGLPDYGYDNEMKILLNKIIIDRNNAAKLITSMFKRYIFSLKIKKQIIIEKIKAARIKNANLIQKNVRRFLVKHHMNILRWHYDLIFFYDYTHIHKQIVKSKNEKKNSSHLNYYNLNNNCKTVDAGTNETDEEFTPKEIKIRIIRDKLEKVDLKLHYSKILGMYYLPFNKKGVIRRRFKVNFVVDGKIVIDPRFEVDNDEHGNFYNIIESSSFNKKNFKPNVLDFSKRSSKFWENIFEIKSNLNRDSSSVSDVSEQTEATIDKLMNKQNIYFQPNKNLTDGFPKKSILRNSPSNQKSKSILLRDKIIIKKVKFNEKVEYSS